MMTMMIGCLAVPDDSWFFLCVRAEQISMINSTTISSLSKLSPSLWPGRQQQVVIDGVWGEETRPCGGAVSVHEPRPNPVATGTGQNVAASNSNVVHK